MERVKATADQYGEGGGTFKFPENARIRVVDARYERRHQPARKGKNGEEIAAKTDTVAVICGVVVGVDEETVIPHQLGCGSVLLPGVVAEDGGVTSGEVGDFLVSDKPAQLNRNSAKARFIASLLEVGAQDGTFTQAHDEAQDESIRNLIGMEFQTSYITVKGDGNVSDYKALTATAVWVAPGGEDAGADGDAAATEVATALKKLIDESKGMTGLPLLTASTQLNKILTGEAKERLTELLRSEEFIGQGVADQLWRYDGKKKVFLKQV